MLITFTKCPLCSRQCFKSLPLLTHLVLCERKRALLSMWNSLKLILLFVQQGNLYTSLSKAKVELMQSFVKHGIEELVEIQKSKSLEVSCLSHLEVWFPGWGYTGWLSEVKCLPEREGESIERQWLQQKYREERKVGLFICSFLSQSRDHNSALPVDPVPGFFWSLRHLLRPWIVWTVLYI